MKLIIKYILSSIKKEKLLSISILTTIAICCAVIISSLSLMDGMVHMAEEQLLDEVGNTDIKVETRNSESPFLSLQELDSVKEIKYSVGFINKKLIYQNNDKNNVLFSIDGMRANDIKTLGYYKPIVGEDIDGFKGNKIIIGEEAAKKYDLHVGDKVTFLIYGEDKVLTIYAINENYAKFVSSGFYQYAIVPIDLLQNTEIGQNNVNQIYVKLKNEDNKSKTINLLKEVYSEAYISKTVSEAEINRDVNSLSLSFNLIIIVIILLSLVIVYSISKVIIIDRLSILGTIRSIGATRGKVGRMIVIEFILYGLVGGSLGILLGIILFHILNSIIFESSTIVFSINIVQILISFGVALSITVISSYKAIRKISRLSIRELISSNYIKPEKKYLIREISGICLLVLSVVFTYLPHDIEGLSEMFGMSALLFVIIGLVCLIPTFSRILNKILIILLRLLFKSESTLALMNLRNDIHMNKNVTLLALTITGLLLVGNVGFSIINATQSFFNKDVSFDIWLTGQPLDSVVLSEIVKVEGVDSAFGSIEYYDAEIPDEDLKITRIMGVDKNKEIFNYIDMNVENKNDIDKLYNGRNIMVSEFLKSKLELSVGDTIDIKIENSILSYTVVGYFDSLLDGGNVILCSSEQLSKELSSSDFKYIYINVSDMANQNIITQILKDKYTNLNPTVLTTEELIGQESTNTEMLMQIFKVFIIISTLLCLLGTVTNTITSIQARKKSIGIMRSIGMSGNQTRKVLLIEALVCGLLASLGSGLGTYLVVYIMPYFFRTVSAPELNVVFPLKYYLICSIVGIIISEVSSIIHAKRVAKTNIVDVIRN